MVDLVIWLFGALRVGGKREREHLRHHTLSQREKVRPASITQMQHVNRERWVWSCKKGVWLRLHFVYSQEALLCNPLLLKKKHLQSKIIIIDSASEKKHPDRGRCIWNLSSKTRWSQAQWSAVTEDFTQRSSDSALQRTVASGTAFDTMAVFSKKSGVVSL